MAPRAIASDRAATIASFSPGARSTRPIARMPCAMPAAAGSIVTTTVPAIRRRVAGGDERRAAAGR